MILFHISSSIGVCPSFYPNDFGSFGIYHVIRIWIGAACRNIYSMSGKPSDDTTGQVRPEVDGSDEKVEIANQNEKEVMPSPQEEVLCFLNICDFSPLAPYFIL